MSRNQNSRFSTLPKANISRSQFDRSSSLKTSFNVGDVVPFYLDEVLPGDTFKISTSKVVRFQTLLTPMMDNVYLDTYYFFVPNRLVWDHWKEFNGENTQSAWIPEVEYSIPQVTAPSGGWNIGTIADYFGIPTGVSGLSVSALPFRAYTMIMNEWFRDQNLVDPLLLDTDDTTRIGSNDAGIDKVELGGKPFVAAKYHDYFTSCLPAPQKGPDVMIPVTGAGAALPVVPLNQDALKAPGLPTGMINGVGAGYPNSSGYPFKYFYGYNPSGSANYDTFDEVPKYSLTPDSAGENNFVVPANLWAINTGSQAAATINQLRMAFQIQKLYERDARGGTRYTEILRSHFGVVSPDARLQRPEYLGGNRIPININQVIQTSGTVEGSTPQGATSGQSLTTDRHSDFTKSFTEHGYVIGLLVARYDHTYQQGLDRLWSRKGRFDFYWPVLANIGEQAVKNKEIYAQGTDVDDEVFGYQEAWAEYRYKPNRVTGEMRSSAPASLDIWHLGDDYSALPRLSAEWIQEDAKTVDRVLAVQSSVSNQLFADLYVKNICTRPMPMYSIPGLIDHH
uniref:Major capsid protein n=1 Tax=Microviridae sp. ctqt312 TaxID=2825006 RepID=A0A8S5UQX5_9VIRU|nr:MAG TPA: major capsid protein [Microviridae sp. ctqt312]